MSITLFIYLFISNLFFVDKLKIAYKSNRITALTKKKQIKNNINAMRAPAERSSGLDFNIKITSYEGVTISVNKPNSGSANLQYINKT